MERDISGVLRREEQITLYLRGLYEQYGYRKFRMGRFEEYDLYLENKNFLKSPDIITFHDLDGRVLALKPDVTLSIAKNTHATVQSSEKFYYLENVYRLDKPSGGYREISQIGLECIGRLGLIPTFEVLSLAQKTLKAVGRPSRMQVSHMGFVTSLMEGLGIEPSVRGELLECVRGKKSHELKERADRLGVTPAASALMGKVAELAGDFSETLARAREVAITQSMTDALNQLEKVYELMEQSGDGDGLVLDFSLVNDIDYYDGIVFQGYVEGVPRALLAGGYYGNLLKKFGRDLDAIGFAVYLNEMNLLFRDGRRLDADALVLYREEEDGGQLIRAARELMDKGLSVRLEKEIPAEMRYGALYRFERGKLVEVREDA